MAASASPASDAAAPLDRELADLRDQGKQPPGPLLPELAAAGASVADSSNTSPAAALRRDVKTQCSIMLASRHAPASSSSASGLAPRAALQRAHAQQCAYRAAAPVTAFRVRDPDPRAVDGGRVLGLRFEVMSRGQFLRPYYVMLNRPFAHAPARLRLHRHTVPPAVPVAGLAARHLPAPPPPAAAAAGHDDDGPEPPDHHHHHDGQQQQRPSRPQRLDRFVAALRREIVRYHNRLGLSADLRRRLGLHHRTPRPGPPPAAHAVVEVGIADIEARQVKLAWADGRAGRLVMDDDGAVRDLVVFDARGRDWDTPRDLLEAGGRDRVEDVARRLHEGGAAAAAQPDCPPFVSQPS